MALAPASFASHALTLAEFVAHKPEHLTFEEAATIPICFLTVQHALRDLGKIRPGERVLIHAATGGVGLAAIQIARQANAEIFATAGSPRKREYLAALGIEHIMDSRSLEFREQIMEATNGEGIDLVVNSLTGDAIGAGLSVLREGGRFLELGKTDLWDQARVDQFKPGVTFFPIALDHMMADTPGVVGALMREVVPQFVARSLEALPVKSYPLVHVVDALRHMARTEHIGKVAIQPPAPTEFSDRGLTVRDDGAYLVTGGLGGIGLKVAHWLADRGAKNLVLVGRSAASADARRQLDALEKAGVRVVTRSVDVGDRSALAALVEEIRRDLGPLRGIFHLAGVLDDGVLTEQSRERFDRVMAAKAQGAWYLHELTEDDALDLFVLFSSAASLVGSPGQGNYAAANGFLDGLAHYRRWQKRPAISVNWGAWAEVGMAARLGEADIRRLAAAGLGSIEPGRGLRTLEQLIADGMTQAGVLPIDWSKFFARIPAGSEPAWLSEMAREARAAALDADGPADLLEELQKVTPGERLETALLHIRKQAARVLAIDEDNLPDPRRTLNELGFDSLTGVEFVNRVGRSVGQQFNPALLFDYPTLEALSGYVVRELLRLDCESGGCEPEPEPATTEEESRAATAAAVQEMTEEGLNALVAKQLEQLSA
jgi:myxalamid-type polyketide synthase MxaB